MLAIVILAFLGGACQGEPTAAGEAELEALKSDPIADFEPPNATLTSEEEEPAREPDAFGVVFDTEIRRTYEIDASPGEAVTSFKGPAEEAGWTLVEVECSRFDRRTHLTFTKQIADFSAVLDVTAIHVDPAASVRVEEVLSPGPPPLDPVVDRPGVPRRDPFCIDDLDPSDPDLQPPGDRRRSGKELCDLLPLRKARSIVPSIRKAELTDNSPVVGCAYLNSSGLRQVLLEDASRNPRVWYEQYQYSALGATDSMFLLDDHGQDRAGGVWIDTPGAPVELRGILEYASIDERQLLKLAEIVIAQASE